MQNIVLGENMYRKGLFRGILFAVLGCLAWTYAAAKPIDVLVFTSPYCVHCRHLKEDKFIENFAARHKGEVNIVHYDVTQGQGNLVFIKAMEARGATSMGIPTVIIGDEVLQGYPRSINRCEEVLEQVLSEQKAAQEQQPAVQNEQDASAAPLTEENSVPAAQELAAQDKPEETPAAQSAAVSDDNASETAAAPAPDKDSASAQEQALAQHEAMFSQITVWAIIGAGLADGVNPCAFAVIVFFISFLAVYKYNRKEVILVGISYCASVFAAYVLLGFGAFRFLYAMKGFTYVTLIVQWVTIALCALFFALSLYDFIVYQRTKKSEKMLLQLPKSYKQYIHKVMHFFLREKHDSSWRLVLAACAVGFVVSLVEAVCTGQVYLPTIMIILKEADKHFFRAAEYLLLYNLMFIVPLVLVFVLAVCGKESATFNNWLKKHLGLTKLLLCCVFLGLLVLLLANNL